MKLLYFCLDSWIRQWARHRIP